MTGTASAQRALVTAIAGLALVTLSGCSIGDACPAVGWSSTLTVTASAPVPEGAVLEVCDDETCVIEGPALAVVPLDKLETPELRTADPAPHLDEDLPEETAMPAPFRVTANDSGGWTVGDMNALPAQLTLRLRAAGSPDLDGADTPPGVGRILTQTTTALDWRRVGGSERCGGPHEATAALPEALD